MPYVRQIYVGRIVTLQLEETTLPTGVSATFEVVHHPGAAAIVALNNNHEVTLVHQFRHAAGGFIWEIPAGTLNHGEEPLACAVRELREEAGLLATEWTRLGSMLTSPGFCDERIHLFLARNLSVTQQRLEHDELLTPHHTPLTRALQMIGDGDIQDAKTIAGLHHTASFLSHHAR